MKTEGRRRRNEPEIITKDRNNDLSLSLAYVEAMTNTGSWKYNMKTKILSCSENFYRLLGYEPFEFEATPHNLLQLIPGEKKQDIKNFIKKEVQNNSFNQLEVSVKTKKGQVKLMLCNVREIKTDSTEPSLAGTLHDITEDVRIRNELEERSILAEMLIENSVDMIAAYNNDLKLIAWNRRCEQWYGKTKKEVMGKHILEVFPHFKEKEIMKQLEEVKHGMEFHFSENKYKNIDGYYDSFLIPLKNKKDQILGILVIIHDITEIKNATIKLKHLNESLVQKNEEFVRSNKELSSFSYIASHDLQEPLRKIQTFSLRIIEKETENLSADGKGYLKRMISACERMQNLIDDLLTFSRTNSTPKEFEKTDLNKLAKDIKNDLKESLDEKKAILQIDPLPAVNVIPFQFKQLIENLILNSLKYHKPGITPVIKIFAQKTTLPGEETGKSYYRISITDNGIGFEQEYAARIFELFQRLHGKHEYPGTGLGLAICKKIVQNHNGIIQAEGKPGQGATFSIYLPEAN